MGELLEPFRWRDVFDYLQFVRSRERGGVPALRELHDLLRGYGLALYVHGIEEDAPSMGHFDFWLRRKADWASGARTWAEAILQHAGGEEAAIELFFDLVDAYRRLRPLRIGSVTLAEQHPPSPRGVAAPRRITLVQYAPEPLLFLRLHYPEHSVDEMRYPAPDGRFEEWSAENARAWAHAQFNLPPEAWTFLSPA